MDPQPDDSRRVEEPTSERYTVSMGRLLIAAGIVLVVAGLAVQLGLPGFLPLGRLPGDIIIRRGNATFYFPFVTCIVVSVVLTIIGALLRR